MTDHREPDDEGRSDESAKGDVSAEPDEQSGIEIDAYGIKARIEPTETGEPDPKTWKEVGQAVNDKLKSIAVNLVGVVGDTVVGTRMILRGLARIPASIARRIERGHEKADRIEAKAQEKREQKQLPPPSAAVALERIESMILKKQAEGFAAEVVDLEDGRQALVFVKPEDRAIVGPLILKALPPPSELGGEAPKKQSKRARRKKPEAGAGA
jgi:hypothetical protein